MLFGAARLVCIYCIVSWLFVVGLVWLLCVACGFGLLLLSVFGWVCFNLMVFVLVFSCCV